MSVARRLEALTDMRVAERNRLHAASLSESLPAIIRRDIQRSIQTQKRAIDRLTRAAQVDPAIIADSARWGDYRRDVHQYKTGPYELYTRDEHWRPEITRLLTEYFPKRTAVVLQQFRDAGLYPKAP